MKVVFICGPYRDDDPARRLLNIATAGFYAMKYSMQGYAVICPHKNTSSFDLHDERDEHWLLADQELLMRSDIVVVLPEWRKSAGCALEHALATKLNKQIIYEDPIDYDPFV